MVTQDVAVSKARLAEVISSYLRSFTHLPENDPAEIKL